MTNIGLTLRSIAHIDIIVLRRRVSWWGRGAPMTVERPRNHGPVYVQRLRPPVRAQARVNRIDRAHWKRRRAVQAMRKGRPQ